MLKLEPYIYFDGNCEEAFTFYKSVFGGEFDGLTRYKDIPDEEKKMEIDDLDKIIHIGLPIGETVILMGTDASSDIQLKIGNNISLAISTQKEEIVRKLFEDLSEGGKVLMPLEKNFWAELYGMLTDKFGINWVISKAKGEDA